MLGGCFLACLLQLGLHFRNCIWWDFKPMDSLAQGKDALKNLKDSGNKIFADSLAVQFGPSQTAFKVVWPHLGLGIDGDVSIPAVPGGSVLA